MMILILILQVLIINCLVRHIRKAIAAHDELLARFQDLEAYVGPERCEDD